MNISNVLPKQLCAICTEALTSAVAKIPKDWDSVSFYCHVNAVLCEVDVENGQLGKMMLISPITYAMAKATAGDNWCGIDELQLLAQGKVGSVGQCPAS